MLDLLSFLFFLPAWGHFFFVIQWNKSSNEIFCTKNPLPVIIFFTGTSGKEQFTGNAVKPVKNWQAYCCLYWHCSKFTMAMVSVTNVTTAMRFTTQPWNITTKLHNIAGTPVRGDHQELRELCPEPGPASGQGNINIWRPQHFLISGPPPPCPQLVQLNS